MLTTLPDLGVEDLALKLITSEAGLNARDDSIPSECLLRAARDSQCYRRQH